MQPQRLLTMALAISALLPAAAMAETIGAQTFGVASWYGGRHDGRRTSSGEIFHQEGLTAASRSLPLGTRVRVTSQDTGQSVVVTVNDRMGGRTAIIDLSKGAARQIGLLGRGRGAVAITSATDEPIEVAEATEEEAADITPQTPPVRRGHIRHGRRTQVASHRFGHAASITLARHVVHPHAVRRRV